MFPRLVSMYSREVMDEVPIISSHYGFPFVYFQQSFAPVYYPKSAKQLYPSLFQPINWVE